MTVSATDTQAKRSIIRAFKYSFGADELAALKESFESEWIGIGIFRQLFEQRLARLTGTSFCVGTNSGTAALHLALRVLDLQGHEVITTPLTYVATNHAILYNGGTPVFCDVEQDTGNIDATRICERITDKTRAIVVVHLNGHACDMEPILAIAKDKNLYVVEDACQALGGFYRGNRLGSLGDLGCFSFGSKNITTCDGGAVVHSHHMWSARLTQLRHLGHTGNDSLDCFREDIKELGFQYGMNDLAAVIGLAQLKNFECQQARRSEIVQRYQAGLEDVSYIELQTEKPYAKNGWPLFAVRVKSWKMAALHGHLTSRGIFTEVIYPNHLYDLYRPYYKRLPVAEAIWREILCLPTYPLLTDTEVDRIIDTIKQFGK